jgi:hypothetical protein
VKKGVAISNPSKAIVATRQKVMCSCKMVVPIISARKWLKYLPRCYDNESPGLLSAVSNDAPPGVIASLAPEQKLPVYIHIMPELVQSSTTILDFNHASVCQGTMIVPTLSFIQVTIKTERDSIPKQEKVVVLPLCSSSVAKQQVVACKKSTSTHRPLITAGMADLGRICFLESQPLQQTMSLSLPSQ